MPKTRKTAPETTPPELPEAFYRLTALLHTMRCIGQHEDRLCLLRNEIKRTHAVAPALLKELHTLLEELPSDDYTNDLHAVEAALSPVQRPQRRPPEKAHPELQRKLPDPPSKVLLPTSPTGYRFAEDPW